MLNNFSFPLQLFLSLENTKTTIWTSNTVKPNHYFILLNSSWFFAMSNILKNDLLTQNTTLVESSAVDTLKYKKIFKHFDLAIKNRLLTFYSFYNYILKSRITIILYKNDNSLRINSIDTIFKNANWLEREFGEMYGIYFNLKTDSRKLLLDYTFNENPMLKDFSCESSTDNFFNIFEEKVCYIQNNIIEL